MKHDVKLWCDGTHHEKEDDASYTEHPRVYFAYDEKGHAQCPYCGKVFDHALQSSTEKKN